jgi:hypothetical protein
MEWLKKIAPTVGTLLGGPLGGIAAQALGDILGGEKTVDAVTNALQKNTLTAEQLAAIKKADAELELKLKEMGVELAKIEMQDRDSARQMQSATGSWTPAALACVVTLGFFGILMGLMTGDLKLWDNPGLTLLLGALSTSWGCVISFYFGASHQQNTPVK